MEIKKTAKKDLQSKKSIFSLIGLLVAIIAIYGLFSVSNGNVAISAVQKQPIEISADIPPITRPEEPTKQPQRAVVIPIITDMFKVVENDIVLDDPNRIFDISQEDEIPPYSGVDFGSKEVAGAVIPEDVPIFKAEVDPDFQGAGKQSNDKFRAWVQKNVRYPQIALDNNMTGAVNLKFVIGQNGLIREIIVLSSPDSSLTEEVKRVLNASPAWTPGLQRGKPVSVYGTIKIVFTL